MSGSEVAEQSCSLGTSESPTRSRRITKKNQNKLTSFVARRSRSDSLNKRKEMVTKKTNPPPPKLMKNMPCNEKQGNILTKQMDWFEPHITNKNDYS